MRSVLMRSLARPVGVRSFASSAIRTSAIKSTPVNASPIGQADGNAVNRFTPSNITKPAGITGLSPTLKKFTLEGKVAVITGGARGLGHSMTEAFCESGAKGVAILDVLPEQGMETVKVLTEKYGIPATFYKVDVRNDEMVRAAVDEVARDHGHIDVLLCAAGIADSNIPAEKYDMTMFRRLIDINLSGTFVTAQAVANNMISKGHGGSLIFVASMSGHIVNFPQQQCCYNASKAGVSQLMKSLAAEWADKGIRVNAISPGYMDTELNRVPALEAQKKIWIERTPLKKLGAVDDLNGLAVYLASDASSFMTGSDVIIDGGYCTW